MVIDVRDDGDLMKDVRLGWRTTVLRDKGTEIKQHGDCHNEDEKAIKDNIQVFGWGNCR